LGMSYPGKGYTCLLCSSMINDVEILQV
jgi:hypothetical protein